MDKLLVGKQTLCHLLMMIFVITGCMPSDVGQVSRTAASRATTSGSHGGNGAGTDGSTVIGGGTTLPPKVEIRHLIEPNLSNDPSYTSGTGYAGGGSYVRKLTLPKNFAGRLYLAGINIGTLSSRFVKVRFKFGMGLDPVELPATVSQAPGITPATTISVLVLDLRSQPFRSIRLPYDLYDYNDYLSTDSPTQNNRDSGLYCRGLSVANDPTFNGVNACDGVESAEEECLYTYAKVIDQGLVKKTGSLKSPILPTLSQQKTITGPNYFQDTPAEQLRKPLSDKVPASGTTLTSVLFSELNASLGSTLVNFNSTWNEFSINGANYVYRGPYRLVNKAGWHYRFNRLDGERGLFRPNSYVDYPNYLTDPLADDTSSPPSQNKLYYNSLMFPLATKLNIGANVTHLSSQYWDGTRFPVTNSTAQLSQWMDGSNARAISVNTEAEHVGSCNVSGTIEILATDDNLNEYIVATSNEVKLQLVRPTEYATDTGNEVLYSNFKTCTSNTTCGGNECCFNNRCWDKSLVSQCFDASNTQGNRVVGASCTTDLECSSLCCNTTSGTCAPHDTGATPPVLCNKAVGSFCISKEWCQKSTVAKSLIVKNGTDPATGAQLCRQLIYNTLEYGDCRNSVCVPPVQEVITPIDTTLPGACNNAVPAPSF